jgi:small subunit ribosomal protein S2
LAAGCRAGLNKEIFGFAIADLRLNNSDPDPNARAFPALQSQIAYWESAISFTMAQSQAELVKALVDAGVHFGHRVSRWNPKMQPYIHGKRNMIHLIDVRETMKGLLLAKRLITQTVASGKDVLFVGTKRQARTVVETEAQRCGMHYVSERWLGGTLTNFRTIRARLNRLDELEKLWETGQIETYSKKMKATLQREMEKIKANLSGIRKMERMPGLMFIVDTRREHIAVKEAKKLGVKTIALIDTDSDPDLIDLPIPGNDDAMRAIELVVHELAEAVIEGKSGRGAAKEGEAPGEQPRRRSARSTFRADEGGTGAPMDIPTEGGPVENAPTAEPVAAQG